MALRPRLIDALPPSNRTEPMGVLALGLSRTGTWSLELALEKLGYKVYHMSECATQLKEGENHIHLFAEAMKAKLYGEGKPWTGAEFDKVLRNYTAIEDIPCVHFVDELLAQYPNAKVVLTTRDLDSWEKSIRSTIMRIVSWRLVRFMAAIDTAYWRPYYFVLRESVDQWTKGDMADSAALRKSFTDHYAHIRAKVPKDRLLEFHPRDGWAPLCEFLGHEVPQDEPFPRVNDTNAVVNLHYFIVAIRMWHLSRKYLGVALAVGIAYGVSRWMGAVKLE